MEESQAIDLLKQGNLRGLDTLVQQYYFRAVKTAYLIIQDRDEAEDVVQNAFLHAYEKIDQLRGEQFGPWFLRSVVNASIKAARKQKKQLSLSSEKEGEGQALAELLADRGPSPESQVEMDELVQAVRLALQRLPAEQRAALVLKYYLEMSEAEMALELSRPRTTIKWRLYSARQRLKDLLSPSFDPARSNPSRQTTPTKKADQEAPHEK
jgi:RNA polymerase sigma-70 factor (ECF subfamily)